MCFIRRIERKRNFNSLSLYIIESDWWTHLFVQQRSTHQLDDWLWLRCLLDFYNFNRHLMSCKDQVRHIYPKNFGSLNLNSSQTQNLCIFPKQFVSQKISSVLFEKKKRHFQKRFSKNQITLILPLPPPPPPKFFCRLLRAKTTGIFIQPAGQKTSLFWNEWFYKLDTKTSSNL